MDRTCSVDGCESPAHTRGMCSRHYQRQWRGAPTEPDAPTSCAHCGSRLDAPPYGKVPASYCSKRCRNAASYVRRKHAGTLSRRPRMEPTPRECERCGATFAKHRARFCDQCRADAGADSLTTLCTVDDCKRPHRARGLCSKHWRRQARAEGREKPPVWDERRRAHRKKRDALTRGASDADAFAYRDVFERDDWTCGICLQPVNPERLWPDPESVSLDHITPLARGGAHVLENVQCAHLVCNLRKGARVDARSESGAMP